MNFKCKKCIYFSEFKLIIFQAIERKKIMKWKGEIKAKTEKSLNSYRAKYV